MPSNSDYLAEILRRQQDEQPIRCPVARFLAECEDKWVLEGVEKALSAPQIHATTLAAVITDNGTNCGEKAVRHHRRGICSCARRMS